MPIRLDIDLDLPSEDVMECLWLNESEIRLQAYRAGAVKAIPATDVFKRAIEELK